MLYIINTFIVITIILSFSKREKKIQKKYFFSAILQIFLQLKKYSRWKKNIQEHFWSALNSLSENNKKFDFLNT
jgi:hypothetical protein